MKAKQLLFLPDDRYFGPGRQHKKIARELYDPIAKLPLICPHGHVDPSLFSDPMYSFSTPTELLLLPDHYAIRMLYSQGISMESLGVPRQDGSPVETDQRKIWQTFANHFYLFRGTPTGLWLNQELYDIFGVREKLDTDSAQYIYDQIAEQLASSEFRPRALYQRFNIEVLSTTEAATDTLERHRTIRASDWDERIIPTFRPDDVLNPNLPGWQMNLQALSAVCGFEINQYQAFIEALEQRRAEFKNLGATASDHAVLSPAAEKLADREAQVIFQHALQGEATAEEAAAFTGHMLIEMARMSTEDGLVMQIHPGVYRNHNQLVYERFGVDRGADIPVVTEYTHNLKTLLNMFGNDPRFTLVLFTADDTTYGRELAPLAGHYPAVKLGPPWWFFDSPNGITRYFDNVVETAGLYNLAGFNDDTRAFCSIPARHDAWRRISANWVAGLVLRGIVDVAEASEMMLDLAYRLAKRTYRL
ncbi:MAG: glucuronate isomerase [Anaerolineaceae bacterium]|nr:glucuronate isomerase [Anaerolineaceae bacterium]